MDVAISENFTGWRLGTLDKKLVWRLQFGILVSILPKYALIYFDAVII
jgi:hypothetical protein